MDIPHSHHPDALLATLSDSEHFQLVANVFKQLGHDEDCVINLSAMMGMSAPAISHHLRPLRDAGLVVTRREGKEVYYRAADTIQSQLLHHMIEQVMEITCPD